MLRLASVIFFVLALQLLVAALHDDTLTRVTLLVTYPALIGAAIWQRRPRGVLLIAVGAALNFAAIAANGGLMPVDPDSVRNAGGGERINELRAGDAVPGTKSILMEEEDMRLGVLADRIRVPMGSKVVSIGDMVIAAGLVAAVVGVVWRRPGLAAD